MSVAALETQFVSALEPGTGRLLIVLHGLGDSMAGFQWLPSALGLPWLNYLLVNAPDIYYGGYSWYDFAGDPGSGIRRSYDMLAQLLDTQRLSGFPTEQTMVTGFSQGCLMTIELGLRYPHLFAGLIGLSGYAHEPERLLRELSPVALKQRFLITHGLHDNLIPFADVKKQMQGLQKAGIQIEWHEFAKGHTIAGEPEVKVIRDFIRSRSNVGGGAVEP